MKFIIFAFYIIITLVIARRRDGFFRPFMNKNLKECLNESNIKPEEFRHFKWKNESETHCIRACVLEKEEILKNGTIDESKMVTRVESMIPSAFNVTRENITQLISNCVTEVKNETDTCTVANKLARCHRNYFHQQWKKLRDAMKEE